MKNSKIPLWPLFVADGLMFLVVLSLVSASVGSGHPFGIGQTFFCCLMVFAGMFLALAPYWLEHKAGLAQNAEQSAETQKNIELIFDDLSNLRLAIAELVERAEKVEDSIANIPVYEKALLEFKDSIKKRFKELSDAGEPLSAAISKAEFELKKIREKAEAASASAASQKKLSEEFQQTADDELARLRSRIAALEDLRESEKFENIEPPSKNAGSLIKKAFNGAETAKASVEKFFVLGKKPDVAPEENEIAGNGGPAAETDAQVSDDPVVEYDADEQSAPAQVEKKEDEDFFERAGSAEPSEPDAPKNDSGRKSENKYPEGSLLFSDLPESRARPVRPKKGDAVITVNALIGIGNKPYLRGDSGGLSQNKGVVMDYLEIGKWRYVIADPDGPVNFSVYKNDAVAPNGQKDFTISPGEKVELNLFFPMED